MPQPSLIVTGPSANIFLKAPSPSSSPPLAPNTSASLVRTHVQTQSTTTHNCKGEARHATTVLQTQWEPTILYQLPFITVRWDKNLLLLHCHQTKKMRCLYLHPKGGKKAPQKSDLWPKYITCVVMRRFGGLALLFSFIPLRCGPQPIFMLVAKC